MEVLFIVLGLAGSFVIGIYAEYRFSLVAELRALMPQ